MSAYLLNKALFSGTANDFSLTEYSYFQTKF